MYMIRESEAHRRAAKAVAEIGHQPIPIDSKNHDSFEKFREKRRISGDDPSKSLFKHKTDM